MRMRAQYKCHSFHTHFKNYEYAMANRNPPTTSAAPSPPEDIPQKKATPPSTNVEDTVPSEATAGAGGQDEYDYPQLNAFFACIPPPLWDARSL